MNSSPEEARQATAAAEDSVPELSDLGPLAHFNSSFLTCQMGPIMNSLGFVIRFKGDHVWKGLAHTGTW